MTQPPSPASPQPDQSVGSVRLGVRDLVRLEALSDAIIAIAITLLVIDLHVPELDGEGLDAGSLLRELAHFWPNYLGYVLTFALLGIIWVNHHNLLRYVARTNHTLNLFNLAFLFWVALAPFPTALLARYLGTDAERAVVLIYAAWTLIASVAFWLVWGYGSRQPDLLREDTPPQLVRAINTSFLLGSLVYAVAVLVAWWAPWIALALVILTDLAYVFPIANRVVRFIQSR